MSSKVNLNKGQKGEEELDNVYDSYLSIPELLADIICALALQVAIT